MKVRHVHKIGKQTFRLVYRAVDGESAGCADYPRRQIVISPRLRKDKNEHDRTVWHEVLHIISWEYGLKLGHETVERLSIALCNYVDDNGLDFVDAKPRKKS